MSCPLTMALPLDCISGMSGVDTVWIANHENLTTTAPTVSAGVITALTQDATTSIFKYGMELEVGDFVTTEVKDPIAGTLYYETVLNFTNDNITAAKNQELLLLAQARKLFIIIRDMNGIYWAMGTDHGAIKMGGTNQSASGKVAADQSGYTLGFTAKEKHPMYQITGSLVIALTGY